MNEMCDAGLTEAAARNIAVQGAWAEATVPLVGAGRAHVPLEERAATFGAPLRFLEFFAGGGMVTQGLGDGWECLFANDISPAKGAAYAANWGGVHLKLADIQSLSTADLPGDPDLAWASSPCQDVSLAGAGKGLAGSRSSMFWRFFDLMRGLRAEGRGPRVVVLENVAGLLTSHGGRDFAAIAKAFAGEEFRFGAMIIDAVHWVPQSRPRLFLVAVAPDASIPAGLQAGAPGPLWHPAALRRAAEALPRDILARQWIWWAPGCPPLRNTTLIDLVEDAPGDVVWHEQGETTRILGMMKPRHRKRVSDAQARTRVAGGREVGAFYKRTRESIQRAEVRFDGLAGCLRTPSGGSSRQFLLVIEAGEVRTRLLSKREAARLMGLPDGYVLPENYNEAYHVAGDGVAAPVVRFLAERIFEPVLAAGDATRVAGRGMAAE